MGETEAKRPGQIILGWWSHQIGDRESGAARALAARLRRAGMIEALSERQVHQLAQTLEIRDARRIARLVTVLAHVRAHDPAPFARRLGREATARRNDKNQSPMDARFQRLMRAEGDELTLGLIRALPLIGQACNVAALGEDLLFWNDKARARWSFHYFGADLPATLLETSQ